LTEAVTEAELVGLVKKLNADATVDGILIQMPLPAHINSDVVINTIDPDKDVDGLHTVNLGKLVQMGMAAPLVPCTPKGVIVLLERCRVPIEGKHAVVIGRSNLVGKPISLLLQSRNATVTMCHSKTVDLPSIVKLADIVVCAIGKPNYVQGSWIKPGAVVIDVGINAVDDATKKSGYKLVGDSDFASVQQVACATTPVPGGVGPMTVAILLSNTFSQFKAKHQQQQQQQK